MKDVDAGPQVESGRESLRRLLDAVAVGGPETPEARRILDENPELEGDFAVLAALARCVRHRKATRQSLDLREACDEAQ